MNEASIAAERLRAMFDQLSLHGFLSEQEVGQLSAAAKRVERDLYRVISRHNAAAVRARGDDVNTTGGAA